MRQGRMMLALVALLALAVPAVTPAAAASGKAHAAAASATTKKTAALRQFSGVVTALDRSSLTVARTGKTAKSMVFSRDAALRTTGELEKDARVTVWYRDEDGRPVAHKVVVKSPPQTAER